jgi:hypothetical protein
MTVSFGNGAEAVEPVGEGAGEQLRHMLHNDDAGCVRRKRFEQSLQGLSATGGSPDDDDLLCGFSHGVCSGGKNRVGGELGLNRVAGTEGARARLGRGFHSLAELHARLLKKLARAHAWLGDDVDRAILQCAKGALRPFHGKARADHDRDGMLSHDLLEECQAVHPRHLDVEGNHIRRFSRNAVRGNERIAGGRDDLDLRVGR